MIVQLSKFLMVFLIGLYPLFVGFNNIVDYETNFVAVRHVLTMDTVIPTSTLTWRAVTSPPLHHTAYGLIIGAELLIGLLCCAGAVRLWLARGASAQQFQSAKQMAAAGLVGGFGLWFFGFLIVAGEWFVMWQSQEWDVRQSAFRALVCFTLVLIYLNQRDDELEKA